MKQKTCPHCSSSNILLDARTGAVCGDCGEKYREPTISRCCYRNDDCPICPQSTEKECEEHLYCTNEKKDGDLCGKKVTKGEHCSIHQPSQGLMEEEREAWQNWAYNKGFDLEAVEAMTENNLYWLARLAEKIEVAYQKGFDAGGQTKGGTGRIMYEQGRTEERDRIVKMIEEMKEWTSPTMSDYGSWEDRGYHKAIDDLLANIKSNE